MARRLLLLALALAACRTEPPQATPEADSPDTTVRSEAPPETTRAVQPTAPPPTPFDAAEIVFDTTEPPEQVVQIPPRPAPPSPPQPTPSQPPPSASNGPSGSCDVRATEGYCFAYTGDAWTLQTARAQCASAPDAAFSSGTCPPQGRIATCAFERPSAPGREIVYTYYAPYDPTLAELACPGTFTRIE